MCQLTVDFKTERNPKLQGLEFQAYFYFKDMFTVRNSNINIDLD